MTRTVPRAFSLVPVDAASHVGAVGRQERQLAAAVAAGGDQPSFDFHQAALAALNAPQMTAECAEAIANEIIRIVDILAQVLEGSSRDRRSLDIEQLGPRIGC